MMIILMIFGNAVLNQNLTLITIITANTIAINFIKKDFKLVVPLF